MNVWVLCNEFIKERSKTTCVDQVMTRISIFHRICLNVQFVFCGKLFRNNSEYLDIGFFVEMEVFYEQIFLTGVIEMGDFSIDEIVEASAVKFRAINELNIQLIEGDMNPQEMIKRYFTTQYLK